MMVTKQDIIDYVMHTPENTNRAVLQSLLDNFSGGSGTYIIKLIPDETPVAYRDGVLDKTLPEVMAAIQEGKSIVIEEQSGSIIQHYTPDRIDWMTYDSSVVDFHITKTDIFCTISDGKFSISSTYIHIVGGSGSDELKYTKTTTSGKFTPES
jgi:hypothetical protein